MKLNCEIISKSFKEKRKLNKNMKSNYILKWHASKKKKRKWINFATKLIFQVVNGVEGAKLEDKSFHTKIAVLGQTQNVRRNLWLFLTAFLPCPESCWEPVSTWKKFRYWWLFSSSWNYTLMKLASEWNDGVWR